ncbi:hypothetical protein, partial [Cryobacterium sp. TMT1-21]|uniref:hypothetical protein n=1 Tax=Cryobacterium sp. TMT1-21 TaxID=1259234 RepID=UPI001A7E1B5F
PVITAFVKGNSFPALYNTIRDDPGALSKVDREGDPSGGDSPLAGITATAQMALCPGTAGGRLRNLKPNLSSALDCFLSRELPPSTEVQSVAVGLLSS